MDHAQIYNKNLQAIKQVNSKLFSKLEANESNEKYEVFLNDNDPIDINIYDNEKKISIYKNPILDTVKQIDEFAKYSRYPLMVFFGFGNGVFLKSLLQGEQLTHLIVIEPETEILYIALHFLDYSEEILSGKLTLFHCDDFDYYVIRHMIGNAGFGAYLKTYSLHLLSSYYGSYKEKATRVNSIFIEAILHFVHSHGNDTKDSLIGVEHFVANIPRMLSNNTFTSLRLGKNSNVAVMVSTGPSLSKQIPKLKEIQDSVTIICIDASMPILEQNGIIPDIVCSMERVIESAKFFENTTKEFHEKIIFASSALQHKAVYENIKGGEVCVVMRPFEYMKYFGFHNFGYSGIGLSAANMGFEIAYLMNFDNLIIIGQDLAYGEDGTSHAAGHVFGVTERTYEESDSYVMGWGGKKMVRTSMIWRLFLNYFISGIADISGKMSVINATEGGARIDGTIEMSFAAAILAIVDIEYKKERIKVSKDELAVYKSNMKVAKESVEDILEYSISLKSKIEETFTEVAKECDNLKELNSTNKLDQINFVRIKELLGQIDDIKKLCAETKFRVLLWESVQSFFLSMEMENATIAVKPTDNEDAINTKLVEFLFAHKPFLFLLAGGIDAFIAVIERSKDGLYGELD